MKPIRSKQLWQYLQDTGALATGDPAVIAASKREFRKAYKRDWERNKTLKKRELRPRFNEKNYAALLAKSKANGFKTPTGYISAIITALLQERTVIPHRDELLKILQLVSMAGHAIDALKVRSALFTELNQIEHQVKEAEDALTHYLNAT